MFLHENKKTTTAAAAKPSKNTKMEFHLATFKSSLNSISGNEAHEMNNIIVIFPENCNEYPHVLHYIKLKLFKKQLLMFFFPCEILDIYDMLLLRHIFGILMRHNQNVIDYASVY